MNTQSKLAVGYREKVLSKNYAKMDKLYESNRRFAAYFQNIFQKYCEIRIFWGPDTKIKVEFGFKIVEIPVAKNQFRKFKKVLFWAKK